MLICDECGISEKDEKVYGRSIVFYTGNRIDLTIIRNDLCEKHWNMLKKAVEDTLETHEDKTLKVVP